MRQSQTFARCTACQHPQDGTVASVNVNKGDTVNSGDVLVSMN